jgi:TRAP-type C4-dicarboxylate transport system permease small subunit
MVIGGTSLVISTLNLGQISPALGVEIGYVYLAIPISGFFLVLYSVIGLVERLVELFKPGSAWQQKIISPDEKIGAY